MAGVNDHWHSGQAIAHVATGAAAFHDIGSIAVGHSAMNPQLRVDARGSQSRLAGNVGQAAGEASGPT
jgi:hypothetical protein